MRKIYPIRDKKLFGNRASSLLFETKPNPSLYTENRQKLTSQKTAKGHLDQSKHAKN
jgi:hypothetical protein